MLKFVWTLTIIQCLQILQVSAVAKRSVGYVELDSILSEERLPRDLVPTGYVLDLHPFPEEAYFKGRITISLTWLEETNKIVLHADPDLIIYHSELTLVENELPTRTIKILRSSKDPERSWYTIDLRRALNAGSQAQLSMTFTGKLELDEQLGLFRNSYEDTDTGETRYFVGSYFKPNLARKAFPCFDEPEYKAPFTVSIVRKSSMTSLSNMPLARTDKLLMDPRWVRDYFQESPPMATYTLGILISDFGSISYENTNEGESNFDAPIQIWGSPDNLEAAQNSSEAIFKALNTAGDVLGLAYPFPKLDWVFMPGLEISNWGLVFQSEPDLYGITRNIIIQWIGNLITPIWWDNEILNNALGAYLTLYVRTQNNEKQDPTIALILTSLYSRHYEHNKYPQLSDSNTIQQFIDTTKNVLFLRMLHYILGETTLKHGLQRFVSETKYKTYAATNVWYAITEQSHFDGTLGEDIAVEEIANSWIQTNQLPVLTVKRNYRDNSVTFSQHAYHRGSLEPVDDEHQWWIPVVITREDNLDFTNFSPVFWLKEKSARLTRIGSRDRFIIVNPEGVGPFLVNYDEKNWKLIAEFLQTDENRLKIPTLTRAKLLSDALALAYAGELSYKVALDMTLFLNNEDSPIVWEAFVGVTKYIRRYLSEFTNVYEKSLRFMRQVLQSLHGRLDDKTEEEEESEPSGLKLRAQEMLCEVGYKPCIDKAKNSFDRWIEADSSDCSTVINVFQSACYISQWGSDEEFELSLQHLLNYGEENDTMQTKHILFDTLVVCANKPWKIEQILNISIFEQVEDFSDTEVQDILSKLSENAVGYTTLFSYLVENWDALKERFEDKEDLWKELVETATYHFKTQEGLDMVTRLRFEKYGEFGSADTTIETAVKIIEEEVEWSNKNVPVIEQWLDNFLANHENGENNDFLEYER